MFYRTRLAIEAPDEAYPGLLLVVSEKIAATGGEPSESRNVKVLLDGGPWGTLSASEGRFEVELTPAPGVSEGKHSLTVTVDPQGVYADASWTSTIT